jgi:uncharacterized protein
MPMFIVETGVMVPTRDGVRLATDIDRPTEGPTPTLLTRTPYNKDVVAGFSDDLDLFRALRAGYAVVAQDVRGRFASEGTFDAYHQEAADGADTIAWIAAQPWSDGVVGTFGKSYLGCTQWLLAPQQPPALRAMAPSMTPSDAYEGNTYQGGANVMHILRWAVALGADAARKRVARGERVPAEWARDLDYNTALSHLPLRDHPRTRSSRRSGRAGSPNQPMDRTGVRSRPTPPTRRSPCRCSTSAAGTTSCSAPPWRTIAASDAAADPGLPPGVG